MKIVALDGGILNPGDVSWEPVNRLGELTVYDKTPKEGIAARVAGAEIILVNKTPLGRDNLANLKSCRLVGALATGVNNLDVAALNAAGIKICNVRDYGAEDVAQHTLALMLELARNVGEHAAAVRGGEWQRRGEWCWWNKTPRNLAGLTLGIIGFGGIGQTLGRYAHALGMNILAWSRSRSAHADYPFSFAELAEIWPRADIISLHCPLVPETAKIINAASIAAMKDGAFVINTARGGLVDEEAAASALNAGKLGGYAADVLSVEPPPEDNPLLSAANTLITSHIAWASAKSRQNIIDIMADNIKCFIAGQPRNLVG